MLKIVVVGVHTLVTLMLVLLILLHAGRGGGLSDLLGGGGGLAGSTVVERNLDRYTIVAAVVFAITSVALVFLFAAPR